MIKIDLHIHTVKSDVDASFVFCFDKFNEYIEVTKLDCVAVTNHNLFDRNQFDELVSKTNILVLPGIETDLEGGQLLIIGDGVDLDDFDSKCAKLSSSCSGKGDSISVDELKEIFGDLSQYILIPHYDKNPKISEHTLSNLHPHVTAGEVSSPKKFIYCIKNSDRLVPVYFSDCRIDENLSSFPVRQTYLSCDDVSFSAVKNCFRDKSKVSLSESDGNALFQVFDDGQKLSTGLNVILGERSSGKSYTLQRIAENFNHIRYIRQFALVARNEAEDQKRFNEILSQRQSLFSKDYLNDLQRVLIEVLDVDLDDDVRSVEQYVDTLLRFANETEKHDAFSKASLFSEEEFATNEQTGLKELISSAKNLLRNEEYRSTIDKHVSQEDLKNLYIELMQLYVGNEQLRLKKLWINDLVKEVQKKLQIRTAAPTIATFDPYQVAMNREKAKKFNKLVRLARKPREILRKPQGGFELVARVRPYEGAGELKATSKSQIAFSGAFQKYENPYQFLQELKSLDSRITEADYHKYFVNIDYKILNKDGFEASGGERSEFFLLQEIEQAQAFDMLLIDEPESSFDNMFLKKDVNELIKDISKSMPVVLVTHNNTVGASIKPDYLLCTKKEIESGQVEWRTYSGFPMDKVLKSVDEKEVKTWDVFISCLEAGSVAYEERKLSYEDLKN